MTAITTMVVMSGFIINLIAVLTDTWSAEKTEPHGEVLADTTKDPTLFGTVGQEKRLEAILINVGNGVQYRTHVANQGWGAWVSSGQWSGTKEMGLRIEAIEFRVG